MSQEQQDDIVFVLENHSHLAMACLLVEGAILMKDEDKPQSRGFIWEYCELGFGGWYPVLNRMGEYVYIL